RHLLDALERARRMRAGCARADAEQVLRPWHVELAQKALRQLRVVVLSGVHTDVSPAGQARPQRAFDGCDLREVRPRSDHVDEGLHGACYRIRAVSATGRSVDTAACGGSPNGGSARPVSTRSARRDALARSPPETAR